jgi:hypothetical protein
MLVETTDDQSSHRIAISQGAFCFIPSLLVTLGETEANIL